MTISYSEFVNEAREHSLEIFNKMFKAAKKSGLEGLNPHAVIHYCTNDNDNRYLLGPLPARVNGIEKIRDYVFSMCKPEDIKYITFSTIGIAEPDVSLEPSLVCLAMDREIWDFYAASVEIDTDDDSLSTTDASFGYTSANDDININIIGEWEKIGEIGKSYSDIAEIFMKKMR